MGTMETFERLESEVRSYSRGWPTVFTEASGAWLTDEEGDRYLDFFAGAGVLNYGHNHPELKKALLDYLSGDAIIHGLDMATTAKRDFLERFHEVVLEPRGMDHRVMFPGPTGTNSVEAALKIARKATGRRQVVAFTRGFHGMTLGALSVTADKMKRTGARVPLEHTVRMPFDGYLGGDLDTVEVLERWLADDGSGMGEKPAAVIFETVQGEGGLASASMEWLRRLEDVCRRHGVLLIADDIQAGCGRTGTFFSFEPAGIEPDIVCLSKSLSGVGLPLAITLIRPELDVWTPGEHNGTFRGNQPAFVTATRALEEFWADDRLVDEIRDKAGRMAAMLEAIAARCPEAELTRLGRGLMQGLRSEVDGLSERVCAEAFDRGLIIETSGPFDEVVKLLPPLTIGAEDLDDGLETLAACYEAAVEAMGLATPEPDRARA